MNAIELIAVERQRQIDVEGWTPEHDDEHTDGAIAHAAAAYAMSSLDLWPWEARWWKPSADRVRDLVKAGALIAAEIERIRRVGKEGGS